MNTSTPTIKRYPSLHTGAYPIFLSWVSLHPKTIILLCALITLLFGAQLPKLIIRSSIYDLIIEDLDATQTYRAFKKTFGSDEIIRVVVKGKDVFDPVLFARIDAMTQAMAKIKGIKRVVSLAAIKSQVDVTERWNLKEFADLLAPIRILYGNVLSPNHQTTALTLVLDTEATPDQVIGQVQRILDRETLFMALYQIGIPVVSKALSDDTRKDFYTLLPITVLVIIAALWIIFSTPLWVFLPLLQILISMIWTFGFIAWIKIPLSMVTMIVPVFHIAVGTAYCLHITSAFIERMDQGDPPREAVFQTFRKMAFPTALAMGTTLIGLFALLANPIPAIREFSFFACFGMLSLLILLLALYPALLSLLPQSYPLDTRQHFLQRGMTFFLEHAAKIGQRAPQKTLLLFILIAGISSIGMSRLRVETNPMSFFKKSTPVYRHFHDIHQELSGSFPLNIVLAGNQEDFFEPPQHIKQMEALQAYLTTLPGVDKTVSFADYLKLVNYVINQYDKAYYTLPEETYEVAMLMNNYKILLGKDMLERFMTADYAKTNILLLTHLSSSKDFLQLEKDIYAYAAQNLPKEVTIQVTGLGLLVSASTDLLTRGQIKSLLLSAIPIFIMIRLLFISSTVGLIAIICNFFPILVNFGFMGFWGIRLSAATSLIASIAIGLAVDDTIHFLIRYHREFKVHLNKDKTLLTTILKTGRPIVTTTLTMSLGFSVLMLSGFHPTADFGVLMVLTMIAALLSDLFLLPILLRHVELVTAWDMLRIVPTVGGLPQGTIHELNQHLNVIKIGSEFIKLKLNHNEPVSREELTMVVTEVSRQVDATAEVIKRLSMLEQRPPQQREWADVTALLRETLALLRQDIQLAGIRLTIDFKESLPNVLLNTHQFSQVIFNLLINALEAIDEKASPLEPPSITLQTTQTAGYVIVCIADTGKGIHKKIRNRILEPFYTTKSSPKNKGLGLTISHEIIKSFGGRLILESQLNKGTRVEIWLPHSHGGHLPAA